MESKLKDWSSWGECEFTSRGRACYCLESESYHLVFICTMYFCYNYRDRDWPIHLYSIHLWRLSSSNNCLLSQCIVQLSGSMLQFSIVSEHAYSLIALGLSVQPEVLVSRRNSNGLICQDKE